jgi:hypothetical protein
MILPSDDQDGLRNALPSRAASSAAGVSQVAGQRQAIVKSASAGVTDLAGDRFFAPA